MSTLYRIANWHELYENNRSRVVDGLKWVPVPNRHDGEGFTRLMQRADAPEVFTAWILLLQVASQADKNSRGTLRRTSGEPHTAETLSLKTRGKEAWFTKSLPILVQMGWLVAETVDGKDDGTSTSGSRQSGAADAHTSAADMSTKEGKKEVKKERQVPPDGGEVPPRERDELFDALAVACGCDPRQMTKPDLTACGVAKAHIKTVCPDLTIAELNRRAANYVSHYQSAALTPLALCRHWATCDKPKATHANHSNNPRTIAATASAVSAYEGITDK